jgi:hypothetical protein
MESLTAKEVKASLRIMGARYKVEIFEADWAHQLQDNMNSFLNGLGSKIDIIEFFPVGTATALAYPPPNYSSKVASPLKVEISTPGSDGGSSYCTSCGTSITDTLSSAQSPTSERSESKFAVGVLYIEYPDPASEQTEQSE